MILGIKLSDNFNGPYLSQSVTEFWRNWHISLTSWFRDYVYIPLGGNRKGKVRKYFNLLFVFLLSGLWHGAEWSFIVWGGLNGLYQIIENSLKNVKQRINHNINIDDGFFIIKIIKIVFTFILVDFSWIFFRADTIIDALKIIRRMIIYFDPKILSNGLLYERDLNIYEFYFLIISICVLLFADYFKRKNICIREALYAQKGIVRYSVYLFAMIFLLIFGTYGSNYGSSFIYFQF